MIRDFVSSVPLVLGSIVVVALIVFGVHSYYSSSTSYNCQVVDKDRTRTDSGSDMRIYTENCGTFQVTDNLFKTDFRSADRYSKIKVGKSYDIKHYGWRAGFFSMFPKVESINVSK